MYQNKLVATIAIGGKIVREEGDKVYIPFGSEYQIYLKNEHTQRVLIKIEVDGKNVFENGSELILDPNESHYLSTRQENNTYYNLKFIERTSQVEKHRGIGAEDGLIKLSYQFVKKIEPTYNYYIKRNDPYTYPYPYIPFWNGAINSCGSGFATVGAVTNSIASNCVSNLSGISGITSVNFVAENNSINASEAGLTVNGNKRTDVHYNSVSIGNLEETKHTMILRLLGDTNSKKAVVAPKFTSVKIECPSCGKMNSSKHKFCPDCGTGLEL